MAWLVLLVAVALLSVVLVTRDLLSTALDREITEALRQEIEEFEQFALEGRNPETGEPFSDASTLLRVHLQRQRTGESEVLAGLSVDDVAPPLVQGQAEAVQAVVGAGVLDAIVDSADPSGTLVTWAGELRWVRVPIQLGETVDGYFVVGFLVDPERAEVDLAVRTLTLVSLLGLLLTAGASWIVAGQILAPVRLLHRTATAITEHDLRLRRGDGGDILVFGSRTMWNGLLHAGLVDELHVMVGPALLGGGTPVYAGPPRVPLRLLEARVLEESQLVLLRYDPRLGAST